MVDHKPLVPIINSKTLNEIETPRIIRLKEKLAYTMPIAVWRAGIQHTVVDVFSRYPVDEACEDDLLGEHELEDYINSVRNQRSVEYIFCSQRMEASKTQIWKECGKVFTRIQFINPLLRLYERDFQIKYRR